MGLLLLALYAMYVLATGRLQITAHYGVRGRPARLGGSICLAVGVLLQSVLMALQVPSLWASLVSLGALFVVVPLGLVALVRIYGNDFAFEKRPAHLAEAASAYVDQGRELTSQARRRARVYRAAGLVVLALYGAAVLIAPLVALLTGGTVEDAGIAAFSAVFLGALPALIAALVLLRARALSIDLPVTGGADTRPDDSTTDAASV